MTDRVVQVVRDAGEWPVGPLDVAAVAKRARRRRHRRWGTVAVAMVVALALAIGITAVVWPDQQDRTVVGTAGRAPDVTWTPVSLPDGAGGIGPSIAGGPEGLISIGSVGVQDKPTDPPPVPTIWYSPDGGATWSVAYADTAVVSADERGNFRRPVTAFNSAYYLDGTFVVTGTVTLGFDGPSIAGIWTSPGGTSWTPSDSTAFRAPVAEVDSGSESRIYGVTAWRGKIVAIGDLYVDAPKDVQCCGLGVGVWTSRDGVTWKRRVADLGAGFDPYITSLTTRHTALVGGGSVDIWTGTVWTTHDLRTWDRTTIADDGRGQVLRIGRGYITIGGRYTGPDARNKKHPVRPADNTGIPTIWWSPDARNWQPVFTLAEGSAKGTSDAGAPSFRGGAAVPGLAIAIGPPNRRSGASPLYATANGRRWERLPVPGESRNLLTGITGTDATGIYVQRYVRQTSPSQTGSATTVWRVAPTRSVAPPDVVVTALPTLRFDATTYTAPAGRVRIAFATAGGTHALRFDSNAKRLRRARIDTTSEYADPTVKTVHLGKGRYTIYCAIPGHRAAGMEATLTVD